MKTIIPTLLLGTTIGALATAYAKSTDDQFTISIERSTLTSNGRLLADGQIPEPHDVARDALAAKAMIERNAPRGVITIFGSARAKEGMASYDQTRAFACEWTQQHGEQFPILTGGGPGIMEAGNRGAVEAKGKSLYISTYFYGSAEEKPNAYVTDGYLGSSFAQREADLVDYAAGVIIAPGGVGTSWEIFETLSKIQTAKKNSCPVVLLGSRDVWQPLFDYMGHLNQLGTISPEDIELLSLAETPADAVAILKRELIENAN